MTAALLIAAKPISAIGSAIATLQFLTTVSFLVTTPEVLADSPTRIPLLTDAGGFVIKDVALLGAAIWTLGDSLSSRRGRRAADTLAFDNQPA